jgi:hypothetical protein
MVITVFHRIQDDERFLESEIFSDEGTFLLEVRSIPTTAGSRAAEIHVSP